jgi:hypothetical protein
MRRGSVTDGARRGASVTAGVGSLALSSGGLERRLLRLAGMLAAAALVGSPAASAGGDPNPHDDVSSVSQYVEDIPTAEGPVAAGGGPESSPPPPPAPLEANVDEAVERSGGHDAPVLRDIATKPALGAPTRPLPKSPALRKAPDTPSAASAVTSATSGGGSAVVVALVLMALVTVVAAGLALRRARS